MSRFARHGIRSTTVCRLGSLAPDCPDGAKSGGGEQREVET